VPVRRSCSNGFRFVRLAFDPFVARKFHSSVPATKTSNQFPRDWLNNLPTASARGQNDPVMITEASRALPLKCPGQCTDPNVSSRSIGSAFRGRKISIGSATRVHQIQFFRMVTPPRRHCSTRGVSEPKIPLMPWLQFLGFLSPLLS
jgi:hypothetical protein